MLWNDELESAIPDLIGADHPLSLGYRVKLITVSPHGATEISVSATTMQRILEDQRNCEALHAVFFDNRKVCVIAINLATTGPWSKARIVELLVHEVSHLVDGFFERAALSVVDTELRAYYNDWIVGKALYKFPAIGE